MYRSLQLWSLYADLEESLGTLESTAGVYDSILDLKLATPQIILNYALFLQVWGGGGVQGAGAHTAAGQVWQLLCGPTGWSSRPLHPRCTALMRLVRCPCLPRLQEQKHWEDSFKVYERGVSLFR